jgi:hypothetical protein
MQRCERCGSALTEPEVDHSGDRHCVMCGHASYRQRLSQEQGESERAIETNPTISRVPDYAGHLAYYRTLFDPEDGAA